MSREVREEDCQPDHIGMCYVYPDNLKLTAGTLNHPITSMKFQPIGKITSINLAEIFSRVNTSSL